MGASDPRHAPSLVSLNAWVGPVQKMLAKWLRSYYHATYIGRLRVFLDPAARARAKQFGITVSPQRRAIVDQTSLVDRVGPVCAQKA